MGFTLKGETHKKKKAQPRPTEAPLDASQRNYGTITVKPLMISRYSNTKLFSIRYDHKFNLISHYFHFFTLCSTNK